MALTSRGVVPLLLVFDLPRSLAFYGDLLGFELLQSADFKGRPYWAMLQLGGARIMLNSKYEDDVRPAESPGPHRHDLVLYFDSPDVDAAFAFLVSRGLDLLPPKVRDYGMKQLTLHDPDGFELCFQQPAR